MQVQPVDRDLYISFIKEHPLGNFLQYPSWAEVKTEWNHDLLGWFQDGKLVGVALVLYRKTPAVKKYLAYIPRGPIIDWESGNLREWFQPLFNYLQIKNVFTIKMDPPVVRSIWRMDTIRAALKEIREQGGKKRLRDVAADEVNTHALVVEQQLNELGWKKQPSEGVGSSVGQPGYVFRLPLENRTLDDIFAGFHKNWRRNVRKSERNNIEVTIGDESDLRDFYDLLLITAERDNYRVRGYEYFERMYKALKKEDPDRIRLYLAKFEGKLLASTLAIYSNRHVWYLYGASSNDLREKMPNHAIQWRMIQDAYNMGAHTYDFRGISSTLDEEDPLFGLLRFKLGFGGEAHELIGEWDYPLQPMLHWAFDMYMKRR